MKSNDNAKILLMDDDEMIRNLAKDMLEHGGYTVHTACDGEQAIEMYQQSMGQQKTYDCVIMDLTIPGGMGGAEAVQELLKMDPSVKAIVSSGYSANSAMEDGSGFRGFIDKPFSLKALHDEVNRVLTE